MANHVLLAKMDDFFEENIRQHCRVRTQNVSVYEMETAKRIVVSAAKIFRDGKATRIHSASLIFKRIVGGLKVLFGLFLLLWR